MWSSMGTPVQAPSNHQCTRLTVGTDKEARAPQTARGRALNVLTKK